MGVEFILRGEREVTAKVSGFREKLVREIIHALNKENAKLQHHITADKLSGQVLTPRSGNLKRAIVVFPVQQTGDTISGGVGLGREARYGLAHEFGAHIPERVPVHAKALHWIGASGEDVFAMRARSIFRSEVSCAARSLNFVIRSKTLCEKPLRRRRSRSANMEALTVKLGGKNYPATKLTIAEFGSAASAIEEFRTATDLREAIRLVVFLAEIVCASIRRAGTEIALREIEESAVPEEILEALGILMHLEPSWDLKMSATAVN